MWPISVAPPVATTTPLPLPQATSVPEKAMPWRSPSGAPSAAAPVSLSTAADSPVSADSTVRRLRPCSRRRSAGTRSPGSSQTMSPGTSSPASIWWRSPPRCTVARAASMPRTAARACSALPSWMWPMSALISTTPRITPASTRLPSSSVASPATSST